MKKMKTFWMDSNLANLLQKLFPSKTQGEFIRKSVEYSMERALKRIWNPIGYISKVSNYNDGTYCYKYFYGFYPQLRRQFVFIQEIDGALFVNALPASRDDLLKELSITVDEQIDVLFLGYNKTILISPDDNKEVWNILVRCSNGDARDIDMEYKAFVQEYVSAIRLNLSNYHKLRYYGVRESLGFPVDYNFEDCNYLEELTGHLEVVRLPDEQKRPDSEFKMDFNQLNELNNTILYSKCVLENELFRCAPSYFVTLSEPILYFKFEFKQKAISIYPSYTKWLSFCDGITNTVITNWGRLNSVNFVDSIYTVTGEDYCILRGMQFDMSMTNDNIKLREFIVQYLELPEYKKLIADYELAQKLWIEKNGGIKK